MKTKSSLFFAVLALFALSLSGCNTVHGAGKDIQAGGHAITSTADKTSAKMSS